MPTDFEWTTTVECLGGAAAAGGLIKEKGTTLWNTPNTGASNLSGFAGRPGGYRFTSNGTFINIGYNGFWWSSSEFDTSYAWYRRLVYDSGLVTRSFFEKGLGHSVRCVRN